MIEDGRYEPTEATLDVEVSGENEAEILEGLHDPITTSMSVEHDKDGSVYLSMELAANGLTMEPRDSTDDDETEQPVYDSTVDWSAGRVDTDEWDVEVDTAKQVYDSLINKVSKAVKHGDPEIVVVGKPQYKALWLYVTEVHSAAENPEQLVPLRMIVVPGPQLHVEQRNLDVLYGTHD